MEGWEGLAWAGRLVGMTTGNGILAMAYQLIATIQNARKKLTMALRMFAAANHTAAKTGAACSFAMNMAAGVFARAAVPINNPTSIRNRIIQTGFTTRPLTQAGKNGAKEGVSSMDRCDKCGGCTVEEVGREEGIPYEQIRCINCGKRQEIRLMEPKHIPTLRGGNAPNAGWFR